MRRKGHVCVRGGPRRCRRVRVVDGVGPRHQWEPRCRICRNDQVRTKVNDLLATGASYAMVLRALGDDNAKLEQGDRVTIDSIRNHANRHFPVQQVARATYREILERRAQENSVDFIEGVATEITRKDEGALERAQTLAEMGRIIEVVRTFIPSERWPEVQAALRGETPASRQTSQAVDGVRMVAIDDS